MPRDKVIRYTSQRQVQACIIHHHGAYPAKHCKVLLKRTMCPTVTIADVAMAR